MTAFWNKFHGFYTKEEINQWILAFAGFRNLKKDARGVEGGVKLKVSNLLGEKFLSFFEDCGIMNAKIMSAIQIIMLVVSSGLFSTLSTSDSSGALGIKTNSWPTHYNNNWRTSTTQEKGNESLSFYATKWWFKTDLGIYGSPSVADINNDGKEEIFFGEDSFGNKNSHVYSLDSEGNVLWRNKVKESTDSSPSIGDIDGDGNQDVVIGSGGSDCVYSFSATTGTQLWNKTGKGGRDTVLVDLDNDGIPEIITNFFEMGDTPDDHAMHRGICALKVHGQYPAYYIEEIWRFEIKGSADGIAAGDINKDGKPEIVFGSNDNAVYCLDNNGHELWEYVTCGGKDDGSNEGRLTGIMDDVTLYDLDNDGMLEIIFGTSGKNPSLFVLNHEGSLLWRYNSSLQGNIYSSAVAGNLTSAGDKRIVFSDVDENNNISAIYELDSRGNLIWERRWPYLFYACIGAADFDGDGNYEIVFARHNPSDRPAISGLNQNGVLIWNYTLDIPHALFWGSSPAISDVDGDGNLDIMIGLYDFVENGEYSGLVLLSPHPQYVLPGISLSDDHPSTGDTVTITADVENQGIPSNITTKALVQIYTKKGDDWNLTENRSLDVPPLARGQSFELSLDWPVESVPFKVVVMADSSHQINEANETDNIAERVVNEENGGLLSKHQHLLISAGALIVISAVLLAYVKRRRNL